jgi:pimeloyl-ACP methyl ester carboxylesterase
MADEKAGIQQAVVWLGDRERSSALRALVAAQFRVVFADAPAAIEKSASTLGADRFNLVAEAGSAAAALRFALDHPATVAAVALLAPTLIKADGQAVDEDLAARLGTLKPPLLALFGTKDPIAPPEAGRHYRQRLANANVVFVYDAGQAMSDERPEAVAELVIDFLHRRDQFVVRQASDQLYR